MTPTKSNHVETLARFGPNFQIRLAVIFKSFPTQFYNIFDVTKGLNDKGAGSRYPALWLTHTKILHCAFHHDGTKHGPGGRQMNYENVELEKVYYIVIKLENGLFQYIVNGQEVDSELIENPLTYYNMKLYLSNPWYDPLDGSILYFHLDGSIGKL